MIVDWSKENRSRGVPVVEDWTRLSAANWTATPAGGPGGNCGCSGNDCSCSPKGNSAAMSARSVPARNATSTTFPSKNGSGLVKQVGPATLVVRDPEIANLLMNYRPGTAPTYPPGATQGPCFGTDDCRTALEALPDPTGKCCNEFQITRVLLVGTDADPIGLAIDTFCMTVIFDCPATGPCTKGAIRSSPKCKADASVLGPTLFANCETEGGVFGNFQRCDGTTWNCDPSYCVSDPSSCPRDSSGAPTTDCRVCYRTTDDAVTQARNKPCGLCGGQRCLTPYEGEGSAYVNPCRVGYACVGTLSTPGKPRETGACIPDATGGVQTCWPIPVI